MKSRLLVFQVVVFLFCCWINVRTVRAQINFNALQETKIDLEALEIDKPRFFAFVARVINEKPFGLGTYGQVPFRACDLEFNERKLIDYQTLKGISHQYLSNPSCDQTVIRQFLKQNYNYRPQTLSQYQDRKCILTLEKIFGPMLEYYTIRYEEKTRPDCYLCDQKEKLRLDKIATLHRQIQKECQPDSEKVMQFLRELDETIVKTFKAKKLAHPQ